MFCKKIRNILKFPRHSNQHWLHGCMHTLSYFCRVGPLSSKIYSLVETSQGRITLGNSGVSEIAMEQKRGLPQNNTNIHLLLFNRPVQPSSKLSKREVKLRNPWASYGIKERVATKQSKYSPCVNSPVHSNFMGNLCGIFYLVLLQELGVLVCWLYSMCKWEKV